MYVNLLVDVYYHICTVESVYPTHTHIHNAMHHTHIHTHNAKHTYNAYNTIFVDVIVPHMHSRCIPHP